MKTDRLVAITVHLLNRGTVSASALAERFEVSKRTIQRDMNALSAAGIPIVSLHGSEGGYAIVDGFKLQKQIAGADDYQNIVTALKGLISAYGNQGTRSTLEKVLSVSPKAEQRLFFNLSAAREGTGTSEYLNLIEAAIQQRNLVHIEYVNAQQSTSSRVVEPLALTYLWYAWYLFAYCTTKRDYRLFKLARISACRLSERQFSSEHRNVEELLETYLRTDSRRYFDIRLLCRQEVRQSVREYLNGKIIEEYPNGDFAYAMRVPEDERMWFSLLIGFGDKVEVLEPEEVRARLRQKAQEILALYENPVPIATG